MIGIPLEHYIFPLLFEVGASKSKEEEGLHKHALRLTQRFTDAPLKDLLQQKGFNTYTATLAKIPKHVSNG